MPLEPPASWGSDKLSEFIKLSAKNEIATFANKKEAYRLLSEIDDCIQTTIDHLIDCEPIASVFLFLRAHASFRAACRIAMAGHFVEVFPLCRSVLENGLYSFHIFKNPITEQVWFDRDKSEATLQAAKKEFSYRKVLRTLRGDDNNLGAIAGELYERAIEYGAHPNEPGVTASLAIFEGEKNIEFHQKYLHGESPQLDLGLKTTAQCGLFPLKLASKIWPFRVKCSGVAKRIGVLEKANL